MTITPYKYQVFVLWSTSRKLLGDAAAGVSRGVGVRTSTHRMSHSLGCLNGKVALNARRDGGGSIDMPLI